MIHQSFRCGRNASAVRSAPRRTDGSCCPLEKRTATWAVLLGTLVLTGVLIAAGPRATAAPPAPPSEGKARLRLPRYFEDVIEPAQRGALEEIRARFAPRMAAIRAELKKLEQEQLESLEGVLREDQRERLVTLRNSRRANPTENPSPRPETRARRGSRRAERPTSESASTNNSEPSMAPATDPQEPSPEAEPGAAEDARQD